MRARVELSHGKSRDSRRPPPRREYESSRGGRRRSRSRSRLDLFLFNISLIPFNNNTKKITNFVPVSVNVEKNVQYYPKISKFEQLTTQSIEFKTNFFSNKKVED